MSDHDHTDLTHTTTDGSNSRRRPGLLPVMAGAATLATVTSVAVAGVAFADRGHDWGYRGGRHWWGVGSVLLLLAIIAATAALTALLVGRRTASAATAGPAVPPPPPAPVPAAGPSSPLASAETILAERLARGEISPDDYRASVGALRGGAPSAGAGDAG